MIVDPNDVLGWTGVPPQLQIVEGQRLMVARLVDFLHGVRQFLDVVEEDSELFEVKRTMARV